LTPSQVDPDQIRRATDEVLSGQAFEAATPSLWQRVWIWVLDGLFRLLDRLGSGEAGAIASVVILAFAVGATAFITLRLLRRVRRDRAATAPAGGFGGRSSADWEHLAREAEAAGRWDAALRCRYRALLADLIAAGVTDEIAGRTVRDYLRDISAAAPQTERPLAWVTDAFEAAWYDRRPVTAADLDAMRTASDDVRRGALVER
jgi:hypothetical protein